MYCVYRTTNLVNGKTYIGQHKFDLNKNDNYLGSGVLISKAIKKYGKENFSFNIIEIVMSRFEANILEKHYIARERKLGKAEYNIADGGKGSKGYHCSEETRKKISEAGKGRHHSEEAKRKIGEASKNRPTHWKKGNTPWNKGKKCKKHTEEWKQKMSEMLSGENSPCFGKHPSKETLKKLSDSHKGLKQSDETIRKRVEKCKGQKRTTEQKNNIKKAHQKVAEAFKEYKLNGGTLKWNEFQKEYKNIIGEN